MNHINDASRNDIIGSQSYKEIGIGVYFFNDFY